jgi:hypothetical protein
MLSTRFYLSKRVGGSEGIWHRRRFLRLPVALALCAFGVPNAGICAEIAPPRDRVILTVTGALANADPSGHIDFDLSSLEHLGLSRLTTWTPWTDGEIEFEGVLARRLMEAVGARGTAVEARALNDYEEVIPIADFHNYDVLLALRMNGTLMRVRDKGPVWIVYPWSAHPELDDFATREKSVWQLNVLHVR